MRPIVHELQEIFEERNLFLLVTLGLVSFAQTLRELVVRSSMEGPADAGAAGDDADPAAEEAVLYLLLGVASFSERAIDVLGRVRGDAAAAPMAAPAPDSPEPITVRSLLA